jgi:serralysin
MPIFNGTNGDDFLLGDDVTNGGDILNGRAGNDSLFGRAGGDRLNGDTGNDKLFGGDGNDTLDGGPQGVSDSDVLDGGNGLDTADYSSVQNAMFINLLQGLASGGGSFDSLVSIENVTSTAFDDSIITDENANVVQAGGGNDRLDTSGGNDFLVASAGNDILIGGAGVDRLSGGTGADKFVFELVTDSGKGLGNRDIITGFQTDLDKIDLSQIDAKAGPVGNQAFTFVGGSGFTAEGQVRAFFEGDHTVVALNTSGASGAEAQIELAGHVDLIGFDFVL